MNQMSLTKSERLARTQGAKGWGAVLALFAAMCIDQFVLDIPFANIVFPILVICAASMSTLKNLVLIALYSVVFELSCIAWNPLDLVHAHWWLMEVAIGYTMPFIVYKLCNRKHKNMSILSYSAIAALGELLYFWVSIAATILLWGVDPVAYILSDLPYEALGCIATFACSLPVALAYKLKTGELVLGKKKNTATV
ncbi:MAG: hypothetical protein K2L87_03935 [Clostridiales bacterium]|nr:hypothetical protein [Clostridiales bacterium]